MTTPEKLNGPVAMSVMLHAGLFLFLALAPKILGLGNTDSWGGTSSGDGINVNLVGSVSGMSLPSPEVPKDDAAANENKGLNTSAPAPTPPPPAKPEEAVKLPSKDVPKKSAPKAAAPATKSATPAPPATNAIPYGGGGNPSMGAGSAQSGPAGAQSFGDGAFGTKYAFYVQTMVRRLSQNWLKGLVDSNVSNGTRVYVTFDIGRNGEITNVAIKQPSGVSSLDNSAKRAVYASSPLTPLPSDYSGSSVSVTFYFEYTKQ